MPASTGKMADVRFIGALMGRYTLASRVRARGVQIFACRLQSISAKVIVASAPVTGSIGEAISVYFPPFGTLRGHVGRHIDGGYCIDIETDEEGREKLVAKIDWYKKRTFAGVTDKREHKRFMPREPRSAVVTASGEVLPCLIIDMSVSGAAVSADLEPEIGEPLALGKVVCRVVRRLEVGFAVQFVNEQNVETVEEMLRAPDEWARVTRLQGDYIEVA